ncbi:fatty-acid amide hydrolase 2-A-like [Culicoides brevitarsis]|uniref:fatty-acid amide hydrolase 2-A-like n=1 Tax=Culicoides brevitarsis TaxID=469753 RepID=UPI00307BC826
MLINRILILLLRILGFCIINPLLWILFWKRKKVEGTEDPLLLLPAVDIAEKIRKREITSKQVVQKYIDRIKKVNSVINAVVDDRYADALKEAEAADELISVSDEDFSISRPFLGVPFTVKENVGLAGLSYSAGMIWRRGVLCPKSGPSVELLIKAGAIPLCVSNTPEYSMNLECYNHVNGRTLNPYDTRRTPGGSTGGEAALLGAGASIFGIGGDIGGSIRQPALNCGVFGHKPTPNLIDYEGYWPVIPDPMLEKLFSIGYMTRYAKDLKPVLKVILGENVEKLTLDKEIDFKSMKVFVSETFCKSFLVNPVDKDIIEAVRGATKALSDMGAQIYKLENYLENLEVILEIATAALTSYADSGTWMLKSQHRDVTIRVSS